MAEQQATAADGRGRSARGAATAARLRDAARSVFARLGYAAARVEDVTEEAGVSHGTFYTYYENKAAALDALVDDTAAALQEVADAAWEGPDVAGTVADVIGRFVDVFARQADVIRVWLEASAHEQHFRDRLRQVRHGYIERVAENLAPLTEGTGHDPYVAASALVAMVEGYATEQFAAASDDQREAAVRTLATIWYGGIMHLAHGS